MSNSYGTLYHTRSKVNWDSRYTGAPCGSTQLPAHTSYVLQLVLRSWVYTRLLKLIRTRRSLNEMRARRVNFWSNKSPLVPQREREKLARIMDFYFFSKHQYKLRRSQRKNHNVSLELYERVEWVSYTLWFHTLNHYVRTNLLFDIFVKFYMS